MANIPTDSIRLSVREGHGHPRLQQSIRKACDRQGQQQDHDVSSKNEACDSVINNYRNPAEFMDYNCTYNGAKDWIERQARAKILAKVEESKETAPISIATKQMAAISLGSE